MRFAPDSPTAERLTKHGVDRRLVGKTHWIVWNWQQGGAITLPLPGRQAAVFIKRRYLVRDDDGELQDTPDLGIPVHEMCHVQQIAEWGLIRYLFKHIVARIKTRSVLAQDAPEEAPCYEVQRAVDEFYRNPPAEPLPGNNAGEG